MGVTVLAETPIEAWTAAYNELGAEIGAPKLDASRALEDQGAYAFFLSEQDTFFAYVNGGSVKAVFVSLTNEQLDFVSLMGAAYAAMDGKIGVKDARDRVQALVQGRDLNMAQEGNWIFLYAREAGAGLNLAIYDQSVESMFTGESNEPEANVPETGDFWEGLWGDDEEEVIPAAPQKPKDDSKGQLHKI